MADPLREGDPTHVGSYHLHGRLGAGGMGRVFLRRSRGGYPVAVKIVRPELGSPLPQSTKKARTPQISRIRVAGAIALLAAVVPVLLYAFKPSFLVGLTQSLNRDSSTIDIGDCAADLDRSLILVPCWSPAAKYETVMLHHLGTEGHHDPEESCSGVNWVRSVDTPDYLACLRRI